MAESGGSSGRRMNYLLVIIVLLFIIVETCGSRKLLCHGLGFAAGVGPTVTCRRSWPLPIRAFGRFGNVEGGRTTSFGAGASFEEPLGKNRLFQPSAAAGSAFFLWYPIGEC